MKRPYKKRIKLRGDRFYYPQYRWFGLWFDYDLSDATCTLSTSYRFDSVEGANRFLISRDLDDLASIEAAKQSKIIKWKGVQ